MKPNNLGLYTPEQVAEMLHIPVRTLVRTVRHKIGYIRISPRVHRYNIEQVQRGIKLLEVKPIEQTI